MHRNRSIVPPNLDLKEHPEGTKESLKGLVIVASGVLDSFSRKGFADYVKRHRGKISTSITVPSFLVNDRGTVGPSKLKKCKAAAYRRSRTICGACSTEHSENQWER